MGLRSHRAVHRSAHRLTHAGLSWQLIPTSSPSAYQIIDPLDKLDVDPVVPVFIRWRLLNALKELASEKQPTIKLTSEQQDVIERAVKRRNDGLRARDSVSLSTVVADAVVRRDGTTGLAVRRYITRRYEELLAEDQKERPWAENLIIKYEKRPNVGDRARSLRECGSSGKS